MQTYNGSVWAWQMVCKEDRSPHTIKTVFFSDTKGATKTIKDAVRVINKDICDLSRVGKFWI